MSRHHRPADADADADGGATVYPPTIAMRTYFSTYHLWSALRAADRTRHIENGHSGRASFDFEHRAAVISAVVGAVAFLEAAVNECFKDASDAHGLDDDGYLSAVDESTVHAMATWWRGTDALRGLKVLNKWELLLLCARATRFDLGSAPYQDASQLIRLRNTLVHYEPETVAFDQEHQIEARLRGKFDDNQLMNGSQNS
jgi:hypothetical protein